MADVFGLERWIQMPQAGKRGHGSQCIVLGSQCQCQVDRQVIPFAMIRNIEHGEAEVIRFEIRIPAPVGIGGGVAVGMIVINRVFNVMAVGRGMDVLA